MCHYRYYGCGDNPRLPRHLTQIGPLCLNSTAPLLCLHASTNTTPITGTWAPAFSTATAGTTTYTFTPDAGQCAATATMDVVITPRLPQHLTQLVRSALTLLLHCSAFMLQLILRRLPVHGPRHSLPLPPVLLLIHLPLTLVSVPLPLLWMW